MEARNAAPRATLIATLTNLPSDADLDRLAAQADVLEMRADLLGDLPAERLRARFPGRLLYTLRSRNEGGAGESSPDKRRKRIAEASAGYDLVDLEAERDLSAGLLSAISPERRILSWHGGSTPLPGLEARLERMLGAPAFLYKLVPAAQQPGDAFAPLQLLKDAGRRDVVAFASGLPGVWTRLVAPRLGAPIVYGSAGETPAAPGQLSIAKLRGDYGLPDLPPLESLFGIVGNPVFHSLSPRLHNGCYRALGVPALYLPFHVDGFGDFWLEVVEGGAFEELGLPLRGLSVTAPHKEAALAVAGASSPLAERIGAANTLTLRDGVWEAESTDPEGVVLPIRTRGVEVSGKLAAVVGAGGAGRSAAVGLKAAGAHVTLVNRNEAKGRLAAAELHLAFAQLEGFDPSEFDILIQATSLGREDDEPLPFAVDRIRPGTVVVDLVYRAETVEPTPLLAAAIAQGVLAIDGREVLLSQALGQFRSMTGREMPVELARELLSRAS
ncbi:MAG TPA: type I 3-dehydroquinate dehydratase [Thermoanaerobaculia bacterium]|jgi:3-dehydroquinate dehydratase/shikimate dehydrogenase|nr:type I 3-dehydroquinate dehydratase [Thermoanaerobaculia bacterium]